MTPYKNVHCPTLPTTHKPIYGPRPSPLVLIDTERLWSLGKEERTGISIDQRLIILANVKCGEE